MIWVRKSSVEIGSRTKGQFRTLVLGAPRTPHPHGTPILFEIHPYEEYVPNRRGVPGSRGLRAVQHPISPE